MLYIDRDMITPQEIRLPNFNTFYAVAIGTQTVWFRERWRICTSLEQVKTNRSKHRQMILIGFVSWDFIVFSF